MHTPVPVGVHPGPPQAVPLGAQSSGPQTVILSAPGPTEYATNYNKNTNTSIGIVQICVGGACMLFQVGFCGLYCMLTSTVHVFAIRHLYTIRLELLLYLY